MIIGYTSGVFDLFHIGHLNLLKNAKGMCDKLVVGVTTDDLSLYKGKKPFIPYEDRIEIIRGIRYVDAVVPQETMDKSAMCKKIKASLLFVGDDWHSTPKWEAIERDLTELGVKVVYFPYTQGISSSKIAAALMQVRGWSLGESNG
jgi:glycerol-3-phosphate cytidylyltransferase